MFRLFSKASLLAAAIQLGGLTPLACMLSLAGVWCPSAIGQRSSAEIHEIPKLSQYLHTAWRVRDGDIVASAYTIAQTPDGFLWIGTESGLLRFDGIRFEEARQITQDGQSTFDIYSLYAAQNGDLWVGTGRNIYRIRNGIVRGFAPNPGRVNQIITDPKGDIWYAMTRTRGSGVCRITGETSRCYGKQEGLPCLNANQLASDGVGGWWVGFDKLCHWNGKTSTLVPLPNAGKDSGVMVSTLLPNLGGGVTASFLGVPLDQYSVETIRLVNGSAPVITIDKHISPGLDITASLIARDGSLWQGTEHSGIFHITGEGTDHYGSKDGLTGDDVVALYEDHQSNIWVGTTEGLDRLRVPKVLGITTAQGLDSNDVNSIIATSDGTVWFPTTSGLNTYKEGKVSDFSFKPRTVGRQVFTMLQAKDGQVWISTASELLRMHGKHLTVVYHANAQARDFVTALGQDREGTIWGAANSLLEIKKDVVRRIEFPGRPPIRQLATDSDGVWLRFSGDAVLYHYMNGKLGPPVKPPGANYHFFASDGTLWVTVANGLMRWADGRWESLTQKNGLPCSNILSIQQDHSGNWWIMSRCGLLAVSNIEIDRWKKDDTYILHPRVFGTSDGVRDMTTNLSPKSAVTPDGRVWFGGRLGVLVIDPAHMTDDSFTPPVHVTHFIVDGKERQAGQQLRPLPKNIEIDYAGLNLTNPQQVQFRYRLTGFEDAWQDAGSRRQAFYQNLPPGSYQFHVIAANDEGVWNQAGDVISFRVPPAFYQTIWFHCLEVATVCLLLWSFMRLRERMAAAAAEGRMFERLAERERIARDLHDTFFQGIQGLLLRFNMGTAQLSPGEPARKIFVEALEQSDEVMLEGRELVLDLQAPTQMADLRELLASAGEEFALLYTAKFSLAVFGRSRALHPVVAGDLCRLGREALYNAFRHACAKQIEVELHYLDASLLLRVRDDGKGLEQKVLRDRKRAGHLGLPGMYQRAEKLGAKLELWSRTGSGTVIEVSVPAKTAYLKEPPPIFSDWLSRWRRRLRPASGD